MPDDHITVFGLGIEKASELLWTVLTNHLTNIPNYMALRDAFVAEAIVRYGECSFERVQTQNAWAAVGVGPEYGPAIEIHGAKTYCVDNTNWYHWTICSGLPGNFVWTYPQLWDVSIGPNGKSFEVLDFNGLEGTAPWQFNITVTNLTTDQSRTFVLRLKDCNNNYPPHPCDQVGAAEVNRPTATSDKTQAEILLELFPSPVRDVLQVRIKNTAVKTIKQFSIVDHYGRVIFKSDHVPYNLAVADICRLDGIYLAIVTGKNNVNVSKRFMYVR